MFDTRVEYKQFKGNLFISMHSFIILFVFDIKVKIIIYYVMLYYNTLLYFFVKITVREVSKFFVPFWWEAITKTVGIGNIHNVRGKRCSSRRLPLKLLAQTPYPRYLGNEARLAVTM